MKKVDSLIERLEGTCLTLDEALDDLGIEDTIEMREALDEVLFECTCCGWWCEAGSQTEDGICEDCIE